MIRAVTSTKAGHEERVMGNLFGYTVGMTLLKSSQPVITADTSP